MEDLPVEIIQTILEAIREDINYDSWSNDAVINRRKLLRVFSPRLMLHISRSIEELVPNPYMQSRGDACKHYKTLARLTQTNKHLRTSALPYLYNHVHIHTGVLRPFLRTVIAKPDLRCMVHSHDCAWDEYNHDEYEHVHDEFAYEDESDDDEYEYAPARSFVPAELQHVFNQAITTSKYGWDAGDVKALLRGSADAEGTLLIQLLSDLRRLTFAFRAHDYSPGAQEILEDNEETTSDGLKFPILMNMLQRAIRLHKKDADANQLILQQVQTIEFSADYEDVISGFWYLGRPMGPANVLWLPKLRKLSLGGCIAYGSDLPHAIGQLAGTLKLEEICLKDCIVAHSALRVLLTLPTTLRSFQYTLPLFGRIYELGSLLGSSVVSPKYIVSALLNQTHFLESIEISSLQKDEFWDDGPFSRRSFDWHRAYQQTNGDGAARAARWRTLKEQLINPISLSAFTVLKNIMVHVTDLIGPMATAAPKTPSVELTAVLPRSLESLKLIFTHYFDGIQSQASVENLSLGISWYQAYYRHLLRWLLSSRTTRQLPHLTHFTMVFYTRWPKTTGDWPEPNDEVRSIAATNGLSLTVEHRFHPKLY